MSCTNCFNGCTEITSDKCVKYTGADIPTLGIQNGDTLQFVEQTLAEFLINALNGSGIKPNIDPTIICNAVSANLPTCGEFTIIDLISGLIKSVCDLQEQIDVIIVDVQEINSVLAELNAFYDIPSSCFTGVTIDAESTHSVLQALLDRFCALVISLPNTYVALNGPGGIQDIITQALEDEGLIGTSVKQYTKMIPYAAYPWFAPNIAGLFDGTGKGIPSGEYENVYLCNGNNPGVPDLRGRVPAGLTNGGMLGLTMDPAVNPASSLLNPTYSLETKYGNNYVTLGINEMPSHTHTNTAVSTISPNPHNHTGFAAGPYIGANIGGAFDGGNNDFKNRPFTTATTSLTCETTVTIIENGFNGAHTNTQPTIGCYYIMYIPV